MDAERVEHRISSRFLHHTLPTALLLVCSAFVLEPDAPRECVCDSLLQRERGIAEAVGVRGRLTGGAGGIERRRLKEGGEGVAIFPLHLLGFVFKRTKDTARDVCVQRLPEDKKGFLQA